jgi:hypothetical protein
MHPPRPAGTPAPSQDKRKEKAFPSPAGLAIDRQQFIDIGLNDDFDAAIFRFIFLGIVGMQGIEFPVSTCG